MELVAEEVLLLTVDVEVVTTLDVLGVDVPVAPPDKPGGSRCRTSPSVAGFPAT